MSKAAGLARLLQVLRDVMGNQRILIGFLVAIFVLVGIEPVGHATHYMKGEFDLATILKDGLFSDFLGSGTNIAVKFDMCGGALLESCSVSSEYGWRSHPIRRYRHFHTGIDLETAKGSPIFAPSDGIVKVAGRGRGYGKLVEIDHGFAWSTRYGHLSKILVKKGDIVRKGDLIGLVGSTGVSSGPHLHFEMLYFGETMNPRNHFASLGDSVIPPFSFANR